MHNDIASGDSGSEPVGDRVRIFRRGRIWYANFQDSGRQQRISLKTTSKKEARRRAMKIEVDLAGGRWQATSATATIEEAVSAYRDFLRAEERAPKTLSKYNNVFIRLIDLAQQRKVRDLSGIDLKFIDAYRQMRTDDGAKAKTRYTETVVIRQVVNFALSRDMLATDPLKGLKSKKPKPTPQPCWTYEQAQLVLASSPEEVRPVFILLLETGMRFGELQWLTWEDVDLKGALHIRAKDGWRPKTGDQRTVPLSPLAQRVLKSLSHRHRWVVTAAPSRTHAHQDRQISERRLLAALKRVLKKLGLPGKLHTFRHTFISNALLHNTPEAVVRQWVGHIDPEIIKLYTHIHDSASQTAMQRLAEANHDTLQRGEKTDDHLQATEREPAQNQHNDKEHDHGRDTN